MPPASSQKGTGKKGAGAIARQRSRNTTPSSVPLVTASASLPPIEHKQTEYLDLEYDTFRNITYDDVVDQNASGSHMPESKSLAGIITRFEQLQETLEKRSVFCDRGMRQLVNALRTRMDEDAAERSRQEERQRVLDEERARKANKANKKKRKAADTLAPHDANTGKCIARVSSQLVEPSTDTRQLYNLQELVAMLFASTGAAILSDGSPCRPGYHFDLHFTARIDHVDVNLLTTAPTQNAPLLYATPTNHENSHAIPLPLRFRPSLLPRPAPWTSTRRPRPIRRPTPTPTTPTPALPQMMAPLPHLNSREP